MRRGKRQDRDFDDDDREERTSSRRRKKSSGRGGKRKFQYKSRDESSYRERARQKGGDRDGFVGSKIKSFSPRDGNNSIRILPPTWDDAEHFGYEIFVNYQVGADNNQYLSLDKMFNEEDPILEERKRALDEGDDKYADSLKPKKRCGIWLIDRKAEDEGPQFWSMPWTMDRDICAVSVDDDTNEVLNIDDPDNGFDVKFVSEKAKGGMKTYEAVKIARNESPVHEDEELMDEWLDYIQDNPVPDILIKHDYEHIAKSFDGARKPSDEEDDENEDDRHSRGRSSRGRDRSDGDLDLDWDTIHGWSMSKMERLIRDEDLDLDPEDFEYDEDLADALCEELGIDDEEDDDPPPRRSSSRSRGSSSRRSSSRRSSRDDEDNDEDEDDDRGGRSRMRRMRR